MPIVPIIGAFIAIDVALPVIGTALAAGTIGGALTAIGLTGVLTITAAVGATIGAIGAITRDKGLQTAGMIIGAVGAVGALASDLGAFGDTSSLFGSATSSTAAVGAPGSVTPLATDTAETVVDTSSLTVPKDFIDTLNESTGIPDIVGQANAAEAVSINQLGEVSTNVPGAATTAATADETAPALTDYSAPVPGETQVAENLTGNLDKDVITGKGLDAGLVNTPSQEQAIQDALDEGDKFSAVLRRTKNPLDPFAVAKGFQPPTSTLGYTGSTGTVDPSKFSYDVTGAGAPPSYVPEGGEIPIAGVDPSTQGVKGALNGILNFADKHPTATLGMIQVAGHFLEGFSSLTKSQVAAYQAQAAANRANTAETNQKVANMQGGMPIARLNPVRPAPITGQPAAGASAPAAPGLINQAPQVTGVPT